MTTHPKTSAHRDLLFLEPAGQTVIACDSIGGIGPKAADTVFATAATVGAFALRGPLLEVLCAGAQPVAVTNTLCMAADDAGGQMLETVRSAAHEAGVPFHAVTGSTEDNVTTVTTAVGVTVVGQRPSDGDQVARPGDVVVCAGLPRSAPHDELYPQHRDIVGVAQVRSAMATGFVHDALPVGSKGVAFELGQLATTAGLDICWVRDQPVEVRASGGPSSCVLFSCAPADVDALMAVFPEPTPVCAVAELVRPD